MHYFMNTTENVKWLKDTHLKGVPLPAAFSEFQSFIVQGNESSPHAVNLYKSAEPLYTDDYYRVRFCNDSGAYAECALYDGKTDKPLGGLSPLL